MICVKVYHVGSPTGWSDLFHFVAMSDKKNWQPTLAIYGDMGNEGAVSLGSLQEEVAKGSIDAILHVG